MSKQLPKQPSLEHLKNEAKAHLRLAKQGDPNAKLVNSQLAVARDYGFASWAKLKRFVEGYADEVEAFFAGIRAGDRERVRKLLEDNPQLAFVRDPNEFGAVPITIAANRQDRPMIDLLLEHGVDIDGRSDWWAGSFGALDMADEETSKYLLSRGATLTAHAAARLGMAKELRKILDRNPEVVHERGGDGQYPLHFAKTAEIVDMLLDAGADLEARDLDHEGTPLQTRIQDPEVRQRLFERGAKTDIFSAIALDRLDLVKQYLDEDPKAIDRRVDHAGNPMIPRAPGRHIYFYTLGCKRPYQVAVDLDRPEIYQLLFDAAAPKTKLLAACWKGDEAAAKQVLAENPGLLENSLSKTDQLLICEAAWFPRPESVKLMLECGFDPNVSDHERMSAVHWAGFHGQADLMEIILAYKPDLEAKNAYGGTVLGTTLYGSLNGWRKDGDYGRTVELLLNAGANPPEKLAGSPDVIEVLRKRGLN